MDDYLFCTYPLRNGLTNNERAMKEEINQYDSNKLLNTTTDDLIQYLKNKYIIEPAEINDGDIVLHEPREYKNTTTVTVEVPFTGDVNVFKYQPSSYSTQVPHGNIDGNSIYFNLRYNNHDAAIIKRDIDRNIAMIKGYLSGIKNDLEQWNKSMLIEARQLIESRKQRLLKDQGLVASLGYKMVKRNDQLVSYVAPEIRRKMPPIPPRASTKPYVPEPFMELAEYENVLSMIQKTAVMLERSPQVFSKLDEEQLRDHLLVPLNSHYEGQVTGETFNCNGKTDIIVRSGDNCIFIAECEIWRGQKYFYDAIDQLLSYSTWRDTKSAIVLFNKNKELTTVLSKIPDAIIKHPSYKRTITNKGETVFKFILGHRDDSNREIILSILVFDIPSS